MKGRIDPEPVYLSESSAARVIAAHLRWHAQREALDTTKDFSGAPILKFLQGRRVLRKGCSQNGSGSRRKRKS